MDDPEALESAHACVERMSEELGRLRQLLAHGGESSTRDLLAKVLSRHLGYRAKKVDSLVSVLLGQPEKRPYYRAKITMTLQDDEDNEGRRATDSFWVTREWEADIDLEDYVVALVTSEDARNYVTYQCPGVFDTWYIGDPELLRRNEELLQERCSVAYYPKNGPRDTLRLRELPDRTSELLGREAKRYAKDVRLFGVTIPPRAERSQKELTVTNVQLLPLDKPYVYWTTDSPTHLLSIVFVTRDFMVGLHPDYYVQPFLSCKHDQETKPPPAAEHRVHVNDWVVRGQGVTLGWNLQTSINTDRG